MDRSRRLISTLLNWYNSHGRDLPWRKTSNPYHILVSEIMLQQTQVTRVQEKYPLFLQRFPSLHSLARGPQRDVVVAWQGMGYNNRSVRLHRLAKEVVRKHGGRLPLDFGALTRLPGVGPYTANAILSFAFGQQVPVVDVNVRRFLSRVLWPMTSTVALRKEKEIWVVAKRLVPGGAASQWNQALMDIGATVCTSRQPSCRSCPVSHLCMSSASMVALPARHLREEPSLHGVPNRIYRGRIIQELRRHNAGRKIRADRLGKRIHPCFTPKYERWLANLLTGLHRDGLIVLHGNGSLDTRYVALA